MLQQDSITIGSIIEIDSSARRRRSDSSDLIFNLNITGNKSCSTTACSHQYYSHVINLLSSNSNETTSFVRYEQSNSTQIYWLVYRLPETINSSKFLR